MNSRHAAMLMALAAVTSMPGCSSDTTDEPLLSKDYVVTINGGDQQLGSTSTNAPLPLSVRVTRTSGEPLAGALVEWRVKDPTNGKLVPPATSTDANGIASTQLYLGIKIGTITTYATVADKMVAFTTISQTQGASRIALSPNENGLNQTDSVLATLKPYQVLLTDYLGKPVAGVVVNWRDRIGNGSIVPQSTSNAQGLATATYKVGMFAGLTRVEASVQGLPGSPILFDSNITAGKPVSFAIADGAEQWGKIGTPVPAYAVAVRDSYGNNAAGVRVDWSVVSGGGTIDAGLQSVTSTDPSHATHVLGPLEGVQTVSATAVGLSGVSPLTFNTHAVRELVMVATALDFYYVNYFIYAFVPFNVSVVAGTPITWVWRCQDCGSSLTAHNITFEDDPTASSPTQTTGTYVRTFTKPGTYRYRCTIHSSSFTEGDMRGSVVVK